MAYEDYTIRQFMDASFKNDRTIMDEETFQTVNTEYIDTAGLYETEEFSKVTYIHYLNGRINSVKICVRLQREFIEEFDMPYLPGLEILKKNGHSIRWVDKEQFMKSLELIENKEKKYLSELEGCIKNLTEYRKNKNNKEETVKISRGSFIRTINSLGKVGYKIDKDKDTVEDLAYMIKAQVEENKK